MFQKILLIFLCLKESNRNWTSADLEYDVKKKPDECDKVLRAKLNLNIKIFFPSWKFCLGLMTHLTGTMLSLVNKSYLTVKYWLNLVTAVAFSTVLFTSDKSAFLIVMATTLLIAPSGTWSVLTEVGFPVEDGPSVIGVISDTKTVYSFHWYIFTKRKQQIDPQSKCKYQLFPLSANDFFEF